MSKSRLLAALAILFSSSSCATTQNQSTLSYLSEDQLVDLMRNPARWDGRTVTVRMFPYDNGFSESYVVCFEPCSEETAERSPFVVYTVENRFRGLRGNRPVVVTAIYSSACFYRTTLCSDLRFGQFTEVGTNPSN